MNLSAVIAEPARPLSPTATEYVRLRVSPVLAKGVSPEDFPDLTGTPVAVAWRDVEQAQDQASPQPQDWRAVSWEDAGRGCGTVALLAGPNGGVINPGPGRHYLWLEIVCPPEVVTIRAAGFLTVA